LSLLSYKNKKNNFTTNTILSYIGENDLYLSKRKKTEGVKKDEN